MTKIHFSHVEIDKGCWSLRVRMWLSDRLLYRLSYTVHGILEEVTQPERCLALLLLEFDTFNSTEPLDSLLCFEM